MLCLSGFERYSRWVPLIYLLVLLREVVETKALSLRKFCFSLEILQYPWVKNHAVI